MAEWNMLGALIGTLVGGPLLGAPAGLLGGLLLNDDDAPSHLPNKAPPYPGTTPGNPPFPGGPGSPTPTPAPPAPSSAPPPTPEHTPPPTPPPGTGEDSGAAADAADADSTAIKQILDHLEDLDRSAAATDEAVQRAAAEARNLLGGLQHDVEAKVAELGPRLNTPDGQAELREFLKERIATAKDALDKVMADAEAAARETHERTQRYLDAAKAGDGGGTGEDTAPGGGGGSSAAPVGGGGTVGGADQSTVPASAATPPAAGAAPYGQSLMPAAGMMPGGMGMPSMPTFGSGGVPGFGGGGDPVGGLGGLGGAAPHDEVPGFQDDSDPLREDPEADGSAAHPGEDEPMASPADDHGDVTAGTDTEAAAAHSDDPATDGGADPGDGPPGDGSTTTVPLPDGTDVDARTSLGAKAVEAALHGDPVADAWQQAGVTVPPPGTPVTAPIPPTQLMAGDVGVWKDHLVMSLGDGKVLVSGQVQPLSSVDSGPDFLGWMDPSAGGPGGDQAPPAGPQTTPPPPSA